MYRDIIGIMHMVVRRTLWRDLVRRAIVFTASVAERLVERGNTEVWKSQKHMSPVPDALLGCMVKEFAYGFVLRYIYQGWFKSSAGVTGN